MRISPYRCYLALQAGFSLIFSLIVTVNLVYHVTVVKLDPLQLVLVGTILEASVLLLEVPTGVLADVHSRKLSIIIGYTVMGAGFILEGSLPYFWSVALAQVVWGGGFTFVSGATEAWLADEIGAERAGDAFLRGAQVSRLATLAAIPASVLLATRHVALPIIIGGALFLVMALVLALVMTEEGFSPSREASQRRSTWQSMASTVGSARDLTRRQPVLQLLLVIGLFFGLYSEGFDRLWTPHLLRSFTLPFAGTVAPVVWFGAIRGVHLLLAVVAAEVLRRRLDTGRSQHLGWACLVCSAVLVGALAGFGLAGSVWLAIGLYWLIEIARSVIKPLQTAWLNRQVDDSGVRATVLSAGSLVDSFGQVAGGPVLGAVGNLSLRLALVAAAVVLSPVLLLYRLALARPEPFPTRAGGETA